MSGSGKEYQMLFSLNAQLGGSFNSAFSKAQQQVAATQKEIQALSKTQGDISAYQKQQTALDATKQKLSVLQQQYDNIQRELQETGGSSSDLQNKLLAKQQQIDKTAAAVDRQTESLQRMERELKASGVDVGNLTGETQRLGQKMDELKASQEKAAAEARRFGEEGKDSAIAVGDALAAAGITVALKAIYDGYAQCVNIAGDFEESLSNVEALSGASAEEMNQLGGLAKELGATTKFTAKESADAMGYMAMAGWDAQQMIAGMPGVLQLAAAAGEDLANVSDIVTDSMTAFGLGAEMTGHYADVLAATAANSNTSVGIMGETFKKAAPIAGALKYSIEDVSVAIGLMANAGIKGSVAGTTLQNIYNGLLEGVTLTGQAFGEVTVNTVKADGSMMDFSETIDMLRGYFAQLTDEERVNNAMAIAGKRGYAGLLAILNSTEADYTKLTNSINNCTGAAQKMAAVKMDNMKGQLTLLNSAWEAVQTTVGEQLTPAMTSLYKVGASILGGINDFLKACPELTKVITVLAVGVGTYVAAITGYIVITKIAKAMTDLFTASLLTNPFILAATAIAAVVAAIAIFASSCDDAVPSVEELTQATTEMEETFADSGKAYEDTKNQISGASVLAEQYIKHLHDLEDQGLATKEAQDEYALTVDKLNSIMPDLNVKINEQTGLIEGGTEALLAQAEAWKKAALEAALAEKYKTEMEAYGKALLEAATRTEELKQKEVEHGVLLDQLKAKKEQQKKLEDEISRLNKGKPEDLARYEELDSQLRTVDADIAALNFDISQNERYQGQLNTAIDEINGTLSENEAEINTAREAAESYASAQRGIPESAQEVVGAIDDVMGTLSNLTEAYNLAYEAAYKSISGQFELWDVAKEPAATTAASINNALDSQINYWNKYNDNLAALGGRTGEIEGLSEVIASFADGSEKSVSAIAGMAQASDEELRAMVKKYQQMHESMQAASEGIATVTSGIPEQVADLEKELSQQIGGMDFGTEAADVARDTLDSYIAAAKDKAPSVYAAYAEIARQARLALAVKAPTKDYSGTGGEEGYASGTTSAEAGVHLVGENGPELVYFRGGEQVLNARETASVLSPRGADITAAGGDHSVYAPVNVDVSIRVDGDASADTVERLSAYGEDFAERVVAVMEERGYNKERMAFR